MKPSGKITSYTNVVLYEFDVSNSDISTMLLEMCNAYCSSVEKKTAENEIISDIIRATVVARLDFSTAEGNGYYNNSFESIGIKKVLIHITGDNDDHEEKHYDIDATMDDVSYMIAHHDFPISMIGNTDDNSMNDDDYHYFF